MLILKNSLLQMLWHRRPIQSRFDPSLLHQVKQSFLYAHYVHVAGAICLIDDSNLCDICFSRIRTRIIREQYRLMRKHFFINSHVGRNEQCFICRAEVIRINIIDNCVACVSTVSKLLHRLEGTSTHIEDLKYPLVLNIRDRTSVA